MRKSSHAMCNTLKGLSFEPGTSVQLTLTFEGNAFVSERDAGC